MDAELPLREASQNFRGQWLPGGRYTKYDLGAYRWSEMGKLVVLLTIVALVSSVMTVLAGCVIVCTDGAARRSAHGDHSVALEAHCHRICSSSGSLRVNTYSRVVCTDGPARRSAHEDRVATPDAHGHRIYCSSGSLRVNTDSRVVFRRRD